MDKPVVKFDNVTKTYNMFKRKSDKLFGVLFEQQGSKNFSALSNISFEVYKGETIGIIGINGSGKSTLSSLLAQVTPPSTGNISIKGETSLVAISAGLNNFLTGLENIEVKCMMHGLTKDEIKEVTPSIIEFADIGEFINQPIKNYSSGMKSRLGFAISSHIQPDILIVDEALSVGDSTFYQKCLDKFDEFKKQGKTIIFISHSLSQVKAISDRIMWLNFGRIKMFGDKDEVEKGYSEFIDWFNKLSRQEQKSYRKKMLDSQKNIKEPPGTVDDNISSKGYKTRKGKKLSLYLQYSLFLTMFLISTLLMLFENPVSEMRKWIDELVGADRIEKVEKDTVSETNEADVENRETDILEINKDGIISVRDGTIYQDENLRNIEIKLPFSTEIFVEEEINESIYKVRIGNRVEGYIPIKEIKIIDETELADINYTIEDFLPILPESFKDSYAYFFAFLETDYEYVKSSLQGLTDEYVNEFGEETLVYDYDDISYTFNDENNSYAMEVRNIDSNLLIINNLNVVPEILSTNDNSLFYMLLGDYGVIIDIEKRSMLFRIR